jgi:PKHD-type hydroxylase
MQIVIGSVLSAADLDSLRVALDGAHFVDGRETAGFAARTVKHNLQAASEPALEAIRTTVRERILANEVFALAVRPKALSLMFSRYDPGMRYGAHVDDAIMHGMRADVAFTLFVSDQQSYDGGELVLDTAAGEDAIKLPAGALVAYPATSLHRVAEVTRGTRLATVGWARSFVRDPAQRELLFDLDTARRKLFAQQGSTAEFDLLSKSLANLMRMWAED